MEREVHIFFFHPLSLDVKKFVGALYRALELSLDQISNQEENLEACSLSWLLERGGSLPL